MQLPWAPFTSSRSPRGRPWAQNPGYPQSAAACLGHASPEKCSATSCSPHPPLRTWVSGLGVRERDDAQVRQRPPQNVAEQNPQAHRLWHPTASQGHAGGPACHRGGSWRPWGNGTHLAAAEDVCVGDVHVEMPEHSLCLLPCLEGAVHPEAAPSPDLGPELQRDVPAERRPQNPEPSQVHLPPQAQGGAQIPRWGWLRGQAEAPLRR